METTQNSKRYIVTKMTLAKGAPAESFYPEQVASTMRDFKAMYNDVLTELENTQTRLYTIKRINDYIADKVDFTLASFVNTAYACSIEQMPVHAISIKGRNVNIYRNGLYVHLQQVKH